MRLFAELLLQLPSWSQQAASGARRVMSASCEVTQGVGDRDRPVHHYSEVFGLGAEGQGLVVVFDFKFTQHRPTVEQCARKYRYRASAGKGTDMSELQDDHFLTSEQ